MEFTTKDNGDRAVFEGGMVRDTEVGKTRWDLIPDFVFFEYIRDERNSEAIYAYLEFKNNCNYGMNCQRLMNAVVNTECNGDIVEYWKRQSDLMERGAIKYSELNWMNGRTQEVYARYKKSLDRHFKQWLLGDREEDHAAAIAFNVNGILYTENIKDVTEL
jgi:hypothetical protein